MTLIIDRSGTVVQAPTTPVGLQKQAVARALRNATYEILPFKTAEEKVVAHVPIDVALTVTTTEAKGLAPTIDLASRLSRQGYQAAPHIAARLVRDQAHLADMLAQLHEAGIDRLFCIGGDAAHSAGDFPDALSLLRGLHKSGRSFSSIGIGGYPEGHGLIHHELIERALRDKAPYASQIITQMCFDVDSTVDWARLLQAKGLHLPIRVGILGAVARKKLVRVSAGLGLGQSARFLKKQQNMFWRFFLPGGYRPDKLIEKLTPAFAADGNRLEGFHVFTFNELHTTEAWGRAGWRGWKSVCD